MTAEHSRLVPRRPLAKARAARTTDALREVVGSVLREKNCSRHYHTLESLIGEIEEAEESTLRKVGMYKWSAMLLLTTVPILSALLSVALVNGEKGGVSLQVYAQWLSITVTCLTILNSIFRPGERFARSCRLGLRISDLKDRFIEELEELPPVSGKSTEEFERSLFRLVHRHREKVMQYREALIDLFLPESGQPPQVDHGETPETTERPAGGRKV